MGHKAATEAEKTSTAELEEIDWSSAFSGGGRGCPWVSAESLGLQACRIFWIFILMQTTEIFTQTPGHSVPQETASGEVNSGCTMQLVREAHEAKHSLMQSQDCIRLMASSAAATEARANQLQDQLISVSPFDCHMSDLHIPWPLG